MSSSTKIKPTSVSFAKLLQEHHSDLRESLNIPALIPLLRKQELLTVEEWEEMGKQTRLQKIDQLIQILPQKGEQAYLKFISCLESENEHPAHKELAVKLKKTRSRWQQSRICKSTTGSDVTKTDLKETITIKLMEQVTELLQSGLVGVDEMMHGYVEKIASLQAQLAEKERMLSQGNAEVAKFQQLLSYANSSHGSQPSLHYNTHLLAKYYHDTRKVLKTVKMFLRRDNNLMNQYLDAASEDSDSVRSRTSSMDSEWQLNFPKIQKPCSKQSIEEESELAEEENEPAEEENELSDQSSLSSADETDDEGLNTTQEQLGQDEHQLHYMRVKPLPNQQRPLSWPYPKKKKASKTISNPANSTVTPQAKRDCPTDNDTNENNQAIKPCITIVEENESDVNEDTSIARPSVDQPPTMEDQKESSCTVFAGYLQKEGNSEMWRKRYFTLTKEILFYSKSEQDTAPLGLIPLIDLALDRKRKNLFEIINKRNSLIKVKKPGKKSVQSYKVLRLKASSEAEAAQWIHSIEDAIATLRTQYPTYD